MVPPFFFMSATIPTKRPILALVTIIGTFSLFGLAFFIKLDGASEKVLFMVI
jgi:hypothetical protein